MQHDMSDCAASALATICKYYKKDISITEIRETIGTDKYGTTVHGIVYGAKELGFEVKAIKILIEDIGDAFTLPGIANVVTEGGLSHFVVINKIKKDTVLISDPAKGIVKCSKEEFEKMFTGILILLIPSSDFEKNKINNMTMFGVFKALILPQKKLLLRIIFCTLIITILGIASSLFSKLIFDEIIPYQMKKSLYVYVLIFMLISIIQIFLTHFRQYIILYLSRRIDIPILLGYYKHILKLPYDFFTKRKAGDIITRFQDAMTIKEIFSQVSISLVMDILLSIITGIILYNINFDLFLILIIMILLNIILIYVFKKRYKDLNYEQMESNSAMNSQLIESMKNIEAVKSYNNEEVQIDNLEKKVVNLLGIGYKEGILGNIQSSISSTISSMGNLIIISVGAIAIIDGNMSIGDFIVFQTLTTYFVEPVENLVSLQLTFQEAQIAIKRLSELMGLKCEQDDEKYLLKDASLKGDIIFENVMFKYGSRAPIIAKFSINIYEGQKIAIVGESGAGKSTIAKLLLKLYKVNSGKISINGFDILDLDLKNLRSKIGYVPQNVELFSGSIIDNIKMGNQDATYEQVIAASKKAGCHNFIQKIPGRYYGFISEDGGNLSGGEKQKIAIARAFLKKRDIFIFDECTSNLDSFSENHIQQIMFKETLKSTTIIIAHRLSTIINCDQILFMKDGNIISSGNHEELMKNNKDYYNMVSKQSIKNLDKQNDSFFNKEVSEEELTYE